MDRRSVFTIFEFLIDLFTIESVSDIKSFFDLPLNKFKINNPFIRWRFSMSDSNMINISLIFYTVFLLEISLNLEDSHNNETIYCWIG